MKTNKKNQINQRQIIEKRLKPWIPLRDQDTPPSGWIKAIRGALGINTRQLAEYLGLDHSAVLRLEEREAKGKASFETIEKVAKAMHCKLVYALVPESPFNDLEEIIESRATKLAREMIQKVDHTMKLEEQGTEQEDSSRQVDKLASDLKSKMDSRIWDKNPARKARK